MPSSIRMALVSPSEPHVTVIIRSYKRRHTLLELLHRLQGQTYPSFEIVVCDQSEDPVLVRDVDALQDSRIHMFGYRPLGPAGARNAAIRHARGDILVMIDDDDLPVGPGWIAAHVQNYADPSCQGVSGRCVDSDELATVPRVSRMAREHVLSLTFFRDGIWCAWLSERKVGIDYLPGSNVSCRRSLVDRIGGWDEVPGLMWGEEQSFSFKFLDERRADEYFAFDPLPVMVRRTDIAGGCARRTTTGWLARELSARLLYFHSIVAHYGPLRFWLLYPLFLIWILGRLLSWIWEPDNRHMGALPRVSASLRAVVLFPWFVVRHGWFAPHREIRRVTSIPRPA